MLPDDVCERDRHLRRWFATGNPHWVVRDSGGEKWSDLLVDPGAVSDLFNAENTDAEKGHVGSVCYEPSQSGWVADWEPCQELLAGNGDVAVFATRDDAQEALEEAIPGIIEGTLQGFAEACRSTDEVRRSRVMRVIASLSSATATP